ncbi:MAG: KpsF/GutQ family sugar-phosphate isomerase [Pseudohongiellaceae bacterium]
MNKATRFINSARRTIDIEQRAVSALLNRLRLPDTAPSQGGKPEQESALAIGPQFSAACRLMLKCRGRVVVLGVGKSGHIARKIAATLASTGTPAMYVHAGEASHGDLGMITEKDVVLVLTNSGTTTEIINLLPALKRIGVPVVSITGKKNSPIASEADINLDGSVEVEACPLGLAPTTSTTVALVLGDALAMALLEARGFTPEDFAYSHPGGNLGRRLLLKVRDIMHSGDSIPKVNFGTPLSDALLEMTTKGFGLTTVIDETGSVCGVFTDGDLRRTLDAGRDIQKTRIEEVMSTHFKHVSDNALAVEAARVMQESLVYVLLVRGHDNKLCGIIKMHDLLQAKVV